MIYKYRKTEQLRASFEELVITKCADIKEGLSVKIYTGRSNVSHASHVIITMWIPNIDKMYLKILQLLRPSSELRLNIEVKDILIDPDYNSEI